MVVFDKEKIRFYLKSYQKTLPEFWNEENYKWKAVEFFQKNWNIESPDFWEMLKLATSKHINLLGSGMYFPLGMLRDFIEVAQERVRNMFRVLYDEDQDLVERIRYYQNEAEQLRLTDTNRWKNHYQDLRAVSVLLWLRYPDKYYIYKSKEFRKTLELIESDFSHKGGATPEYYVRFLDMMNKIREEISGDVDLTKTLNELVQSTPDAYEDRNLNIATVDFVFYIGKRFENEQSLIDVKIQPRMEGQRKLQIGDMSDNGQITIVDEDRLCYIVKNENHGAVGLRTISKALLDEFVTYIAKHPDANGNEAKAALSGYSDIDKFEYGYNATYVMMAKMVLGFANVIGNSIVIKSHAKPFSGKLQQIYYGAPGTGKSHAIDGKVTEENSIRTTFHPDSDYASFVGCYKPVAESIKYHSSKSSDDLYRDLENEAISINNSSDKVSKIIDFVTKNAVDLQYIVDTKEDVKSMQNLLNIHFKFANETYLTHVVNYVLENQKKEITYKFVPQAFTRAYIEAWKDTSKPYYLVIEEINRGNCAQIFGDIFQLLDRGEDGFSSYKITPDTDLQQYLAEEFAKVDIADADIKAGRKMQLPNNLYIWATMNTSDQSLFPIDSAFKRRWEWKYIPIKNEDKNHKIVVDGAKYDWYEFMKLVNDRIESVTDSEDKQIGYWFAKADKDNVISAEKLVSKVIFYLWNDVFKDYAHSDSSLFNVKNHKYKFREFYKDNGDVNTDKLNEFLKGLGLKDETPQTKVVPSAEENQEPEQPAEE